MGPAEREFDIILYGATGFSGKLTAHYLAHAGRDACIALAGRSRQRLLALRKELGSRAQDWPLIVADKRWLPEPAWSQTLSAPTPTTAYRW